MTLATNWVDNIGMFVNAAYLNQLGTEHNASIYARTQYGTRSAMPAAAASNSGATYFCTDCDAVYKSDGSAWAKIRVGGTSGPAMAEPPTSGWTAVNMLAGSSFSNDKDGMLFTVASTGSGGNYEYQYRAYPTPPFTLTTYLDAATDPSGPTWAQCGILISDGTKLITLGPTTGLSSTGTPAVGQYINGIKFTNLTTFSTVMCSFSMPLFGFPKWYRVTDNGTNLIWECSVNGIDWMTLFSEGRTAFLTPSRIGIGATNYSGKTMLGRLRSWHGVP